MKKPIILTIILFTVQFLAPIFGQTEQKPELIVQTGHPDIILCATFSPNGKILASGGDKRIILWDLVTFRQLRSINSGVNLFRNRTGAVYSVAFSPDGKILASGDGGGEIKFWDVLTGKLIKLLSKHANDVTTIAFSPDGKILASGSYDHKVFLWDVEKGQVIKILEEHKQWVKSVRFSPDGKVLASGGWDNTIMFWDVKTGQQINSTERLDARVDTLTFSPNGEVVAFGNWKNIKLWNIETNQPLGSLEGHEDWIYSVSFSPDGKFLASASNDKSIKLWNVEKREQLFSLNGHTAQVASISFSPDGKIMASASYDSSIKLWETQTGQLLKSLDRKASPITFITFPTPNVPQKQNENPSIVEPLWMKYVDKQEQKDKFTDYKSFLTVNREEVTKIWNIETGQQAKSVKNNEYFNSEWEYINSINEKSTDEKIHAWVDDRNSNTTINIFNFENDKQLSLVGHKDIIRSIAFSQTGEFLISGSWDKTIKLWDTSTGQLIKSFEGHENWVNSVAFTPNEKIIASGSEDATAKFWLVENGRLLATLTSIAENDWIVTTPEGRFDTNKLENPQGLHWIMPDAPFDPLSFEIFMRDYYEPNLLPRLLKCTEDDNCDQEFKPVRNLTELNRTQPVVKITDIKPTVSTDVVQVTVEAEDAVSEFQKDKQGKLLRSGVEDLRLFRDGQLVGYAPEAEGAVALDKYGKFTKVFNVRLPKNQEAKEFVFTAYAFNSDRVKSETASRTYALPKPLPAAKGSAYLITIGVNANEDRRYDLRYAANDARKLQEELGENLPKKNYEKIVQIPLISDYGADGKLRENNATKAKIKAVLDILAGKTVAEDSLKDVPNKDLLEKVQPEDLVLIAFSGHGYADREGVFYLIPYDIGAKGGGLANVLQKSISSDELSLWLRDVDAGEMLMIVDACHSAAAVQGAGFKPGPMGSRGLGQLSYDKGMRILTATQADNVALEMNNLQHGLLTYSLVKNGIELGLADFQPKDNKLFSNEWLGFAVRDVPELYRRILSGETKGLFIDGKPRSDIQYLDGQKSNLNLQQPSLFDFSRRSRQYELLETVLR